MKQEHIIKAFSMKTFRNIAFITVLLLELVFCNSCNDNKYGKISGQITDSKTDSAIQKVQITTVPPSVSIFTDKNGNYHIDSLMTDTNYIVTATRDGYLKNSIVIHVLKGSKISANIQLQKIRKIESVTGCSIDTNDIYDFSGTWEGIAQSPNGSYQMKLVLEQNDNRISGTGFLFINAESHATVRYENGFVSGREISLNPGHFTENVGGWILMRNPRVFELQVDGSLLQISHEYNTTARLTKSK